MYYLYFRNFSEDLLHEKTKEFLLNDNCKIAKKFLEKLKELESKFDEHANSNMDKFPDLLAKEKIYLSGLIPANHPK
jgi:hypothetical protein